MSTWKFVTALAVGTLVAFVVTMVLPLVVFDAYAPGGVFGNYYGISDPEMVASLLAGVAAMIATTYAGMALGEWSERAR